MNKTWQAMKKDENKTKAQLVEELAKLREVKGQYEAIIEVSPVGIFRTDADGNCLFVNDLWCKIAGLTKKEALGDGWLQGIHADDRQHVADAWYKSTTTNARFKTEYRFRNRSGDTTWVIGEAVAELDDDGKVVGYVGTATDITNSKLAEEERRRQATIVESSTDMLALMDRDFTYLYANDAYAKPFGKTVDDIVGRTVAEVFGEELFNAAIKPRAERSLAGEVVHYQHWVEFPVSGRRHMDVHYFPYLGVDGEVLGFVVNARDTTEQKRTEKELKSSVERFSSWKESNFIGIHMGNSRGDITDANDVFLAMVGYSRQDLLDGSMNWIDMTPPEFSQIDAKVSEEADRNGFFSPVEKEFFHKDGHRVPVIFGGTIFEKDPDEYIIFVTDLTERKQAEQARLDLEAQVLHAQKLESLGVLAGGIAHDFNNLLVGVLGNADIALANLSPLSLAAGYIEKVKQSATRAAELANQMLAYSGKGQFIVSALSLTEVVREMGHLLDASISKTTIINYQLDEKVPPIEADVTQIRQVVMNLITNASESLEKRNGQVTLSTGVTECDEAYQDTSIVGGELSAGKYVYLEVTDTGVGMDEETVSRIFDPFFTTKFAGRGLGLAALFGIVRGHEGAIKVESEPGEGTTIRVLFPVTDKPVVSLPDRDEEKSIQIAGGTVLLVDDEPEVLEVGKRMLEIAGYAVKTASDGAEAVEVFREHSSDIACVILDMTMPKMGGVETLSALQKIDSNVPVMLSSGYSLEDIKKNVGEAGFAGFLKKPYKLEKLKRTVADLLAER